MSNRFEIPALSPTEANNYWGTILKKGLTAPYGKYPAQIGHPVKLSSSFVREINDGAKATHAVVIDTIATAGGVTEWMRSKPVTFGPYTLNNPAINEQLQERLNEGYGLPLIYDVLIAREHGEARPKVLEIQTGIGYETTLDEWLQAAGYDPNDARGRFGNESPATRYASYSSRFALGEPITIIDTDPLNPFSAVSRIDEIGMQQIVGGRNDIPISPVDIIGKDENGYFFHPYIADGGKHFDVKRDRHGTPQKDTSRKEYVKHVLARMGQPDLTRLWEQVKHDQGKVNLITQFLDDSNINWIFHPSWPHLGDKTMLPIIRNQLLQEGNPLASQFEPVYGQGEKVIETGKYIKKPTGSKGGEGHIIIQVNEGDSVQVEEGYIYQQIMKPFPTLSYIPGRLAAGIRRDLRTQTLDEEAGDELRPITGQLEVRCLIPPYWKDETIGRNMTRYAPRWDNPDTLHRTQTNILPIYNSLHTHLARTDRGDDHRFYPYGFGPVVIFDGNNE